MAVFSNFEEVSGLEWLVSNGIGGYASASICGANTRRYHALLVAALQPPTGRQVLVSKLEENVRMGLDTTLSLSTNRYPGVIHPQGFQYLAAFERDPLPKASFQIDTSRLNKTVFMVQGANTTVVEYENSGEQMIYLTITPLLVYRDYHSLFRENPNYTFQYENLGENRLKIHALPGATPLFIRYTSGIFQPRADWYRSFQYEKEAYRGLDFEEDAKSIGWVELKLAAGERAYFIFSTEESAMDGRPELWKQAELERLQTLAPAHLSNPFLKDLAVSADQFLVWRRSSDSHTVIAGYHWFTDWGRDTMIAMRGLVIALGKKDMAVSILRTFLQYLDGGMIPNRFPDQGETPEYNTFDATLWLFVALYEYYEKFEDAGFIREIMPKLNDIIQAHHKGTRYGIQVGPEGLLHGGEGDVQLTWMDAKVGDFVVTPRHGCPVEINALWYNALEIYNYFYQQLGLGDSPYDGQARQTAQAFRKYFINQKGYLNDVVIPEIYTDDSLRPNQVYALSLPFSPLTKAESLTILATIEQHLYTDYGLRSLAPDHPDFKPVYRGNPWQRDTAYHQGTVWTFLWGEYALAYLKQHKFSQKACKAIWEKVQILRTHFYQSDCLHAVSEIFDGLDPRAGRGCVQQAWSVGMLLRVFLDPGWTFDFEKKQATSVQS